MSKVFRWAGGIIVISSIFSFLMIGSINLPLAFLSAVFTAVLGIAIYTIGDLKDRVDFLEQKLNISLEGATATSDALPQRTCPKCGTVHDFDYPKCPQCKLVY